MLLFLFIDCVYIDSQRPDVAYFICAIKEFRMVSFLSLFFFLCQCLCLTFACRFLVVVFILPVTPPMFVFFLLAQNPISIKCAVW